MVAAPRQAGVAGLRELVEVRAVVTGDHDAVGADRRRRGRLVRVPGEDGDGVGGEQPPRRRDGGEPDDRRADDEHGVALPRR